MIQEVIALLEPGVDEQPTYIGVRNQLAEAYRLIGKHETSIMHFKKCIEMKPDNAWSWASLGVIYRDQGNFEEAVFCLRRAIEFKRDLLWAQSQLASTFAKQKKIRSRISAIQ